MGSSTLPSPLSAIGGATPHSRGGGPHNFLGLGASSGSSERGGVGGGREEEEEEDNMLRGLSGPRSGSSNDVLHSLSGALGGFLGGVGSSSLGLGSLALGGGSDSSSVVDGVGGGVGGGNSVPRAPASLPNNVSSLWAPAAADTSSLSSLRPSSQVFQIPAQQPLQPPSFLQATSVAFLPSGAHGSSDADPPSLGGSDAANGADGSNAAQYFANSHSDGVIGGDIDLVERAYYEESSNEYAPTTEDSDAVYADEDDGAGGGNDGAQWEQERADASEASQQLAQMFMYRSGAGAEPFSDLMQQHYHASDGGLDGGLEGGGGSLDGSSGHYQHQHQHHMQQQLQQQQQLLMLQQQHLQQQHLQQQHLQQQQQHLQQHQQLQHQHHQPAYAQPPAYQPPINTLLHMPSHFGGGGGGPPSHFGGGAPPPPPLMHHQYSGGGHDHRSGGGHDPRSALAYAQQQQMRHSMMRP